MYEILCELACERYVKFLPMNLALNCVKMYVKKVCEKCVKRMTWFHTVFLYLSHAFHTVQFHMHVKKICETCVKRCENHVKTV